MSSTLVRRALILIAILTVWGPPALRASGRELDAALADPFTLDAAALLQVGAWVAADALVLVILLSHLARRSNFMDALLANPPIRWYGLFGLLALGSVLYSASPAYTAFFAQKVLVGLVVLTLLEWHWPSRDGSSRALQVLFTVQTLQAATIAVLYVVRREWVVPFGAVEGPERVRVTGGMFADYGSSALLSGLLLLSVVLFSRRPWHRWLAGAGYLGTWVLLVLAQTRSTMAAAVVFLVVMVSAHPRARVPGLLLALGVAVGLAGLVPRVLDVVVDTGTRGGEGLDTLSGRTEAFAFLIEQWRESPWIGYGYGAGTRNVLLDFVARRGLNIGAGHDAVSTILVDLGLIGLILLLLAFITTWLAVGRLYLARTKQSTVAAHQILCLMIWVSLQTVVSSSLAGPSAVFIVCIVATWRVGAWPAGGDGASTGVPRSSRPSGAAARGSR